MLKSSLFLMASETEGLPMVLLEAMSYGIPVSYTHLDVYKRQSLFKSGFIFMQR